MKVSDKKICLMILLAIFALCGAGIYIPNAHAQNNAAVMQQATAIKSADPVMPQQSMHDDDDDDLAEHWTDPKYLREQHKQLMGIATIIAGTIFLAINKKIKTDKLVRA